jgi:hypothetical protein
VTESVHPRELLSAYLDDELTLDERHGVDRHLALCERCREDLASIKELSRAVAEEPIPDVPEELVLRIARRIDEAEVTPYRRRRGIVLPATIAATIAAIGLLAVVQWRQQGAPAPVPAPAAPPELQKSSAPEGQARDEIKQDAREKDVFQTPQREDDAKAKQNVSGGFAPEPAPAPALEPPAPAPVAPSFERPRQEAVKKEADNEPAAAGARARTLGYVGGVVGGVPSPVCAERWVDTSVLATWAVPDVDAAVLDLQGIARARGGRVERVEPYTAQFALIVPRQRIAEAVADLRRHGATGLEGPIEPEEGFECVRQRVALVAAR